MQIWLPIIINAVLLVVVCVQAYIYHRQWQVMQQQLALQSKQIEQARVLQEMSDRPWVVDSGVKVTGFKVGERASFSVTFINTGRTPANNTVISVWVTFTEKTEVKDFDRPNLTTFQSQGVVIPGREIELPIVGGKPLDQERIKAIAEGRTCVYVFGTATYDIPSGQGKTDFCYIYLRHKDDFAPYKDGNYAA